MAGTIQVVQTPNDNGLVPTSVTLAAQNEFPNQGNLFLVITTNSTAGGVNATIKNQVVVDGQAGPDKVVAIPLSTTKVIGPIPVGVYNLADNNCEVDINTPANVATCWALQVTR